MYLVHVWFFIQYQVFDLEVFFLPSHFLWAIFIAFGAAEAIAGIIALIRFLPGALTQKIASGLMITMILLSTTIPLRRNWSTNDRSQDVAVNDFYANLWEILPEDSLLVTRSGVFGYDAFYWPLVYGTRQDVELPSLPNNLSANSDIQDRELFSNTTVSQTGRARGPGAIPVGLIPQGAWQIPILIGNQIEGGFGGRDQLILYQLSLDAPNLVVKNSTPSSIVDEVMGGVVLKGADLTAHPVESGSLINLALYWDLTQTGRYQIRTSLGEQFLESHRLGFDNLERYQKEIASLHGETIIEEYAIVIPSTIEEGDYPLIINVQGTEKEVTVGTISIVDNEETMERWLKIAGKS